MNRATDDRELIHLVRCADLGNVSGLPGCTRAHELGLISRTVHPEDGSYLYHLTDLGRRWLADHGEGTC